MSVNSSANKWLRGAALLQGIRKLAGRRKAAGRSAAVKVKNRRVRTPTVLQMEAVECGAAALAIILAHQKKLVPLEQLRVECGVSRDGSKASNVLKAARKHGLDSKGYKKEPQDLKSLDLPVILFWNFNHFLVLEGFGKKKVFLNDPATGPRSVSYQEFDESFTGVVLVFARTNEFQPSGRKPNIFKTLKERMPGSGLAVAYIMLCTLALALPNLLAPMFPKVYVDNFLIREMRSWLSPLLAAMIVTALVKGVTVYLQQRALLHLELKLALSSSSKLLWHVLRLPMDFFAQRMSGEISSRVEISDDVATLLSGEVATNLVNVFLIVFYAALMFRYDVLLTFISVAISLLNLVALRYVSRKRVDDNRRLLQNYGKMTGTAVMGLMSIETLKATGSESDFFSKWAGYQAKVVNGRQDLGMSTVMLSAVPPLLTALNFTAVLAIGSLRVMDGLLTVGMLIAFQTLVGSFIDPVNKMVDLGSKLQEAHGGLVRLDDVFNHATEMAIPAVVDGQAQPAELERLAGYVELSGVTFGYSRLEAPLIKDFNLRVKPGQRVALVGGSGSGKSTIAKLVSGLYKPWAGTVLFDGKPRAEISRTVMTNSIAMVDQDIFQFEGTLRDNLTMWDTTLEETQVVQACKDACIHDEITSRQGGYESPIMEGGRNFAGGQRQRIEIARALVTNPRILILDEATSVLDAETEKAIDDNLRRRGCTCLIVAHRLSTIRDCDEIVVLDRGQVAQRGTHEELMASGGIYSNLIKAA
jgi:NHLM bacteriocin system ABC transporter peptidase/ATP-binding protein